MLTQRLTELEERGLVRRKKLPPPASVQVYEATEWGLEAEPIVQVLGRWAARSPSHDPTLPISATSMMLSLKTMIDEKKARNFEARIGFRMGNESFVGRVRKGRFKVARGEPEDVDFSFSCNGPQLAAVIYGGAPFESAGFEGDVNRARKFVSFYTLPPKAEAPR